LTRLAAATVLAGSLCGCAAFDTSGAWFSKPLNVLGTSAGGYSYAQLDEAKRDRPITANDLVEANGACPRAAAPAPTQSILGGPEAPAGGAPDMSSLLGAGIAIGMSECDIVARIGQPTAVNLGRGPGGDRAVVLTFKSGPRPGIYRFAGGRLVEMDRVELPPPPPEPDKKKIVKKKPDKTKAPLKPEDKT
jgi:hypothetical protein